MRLLHTAQVAFAFLALIAASAGCGGGSSGGPSGGHTPPTQSPSPAATPTDSIFVTEAALQPIVQLSTTGQTLRTFGPDLGLTGFVELDDAGNVYSQFEDGSTSAFVRFAIGGEVATATYTPESTLASAFPLMYVAPTGEVVIVEAQGTYPHLTALDYEVWDAGSPGGPPDRTLTRAIVYPQTNDLVDNTLGVATDGTLYIPYISPVTKRQEYDVIPPRGATPSRTIVDSVVAPGARFFSNLLSIGADGTLYVAEWNYTKNDPLAGLYVYPTSGVETYTSRGATFPIGLDLDAAGNVYIANSNSVRTSSGQGTPDTLHLLSVYTPHATSLIRQVRTGFTNPRTLVVDDDGTAYMVCYEPTNQQVVVVPRSASSGHALYYGSFLGNLALYNGLRAKMLRLGAGRGGVRTARTR